MIFALAARARRYVDGVALPLSVRDISDVCEHYTTKLTREMLDDCVFMLDNIWLSEHNKKP